MSIDLDKFFSLPLNDAEPAKVNFAPRYVSSNMDLLLQQARRSKGVRESRFFDYIQVENDPHFSRRAENNESKLQKLLSNISLSTSLVTIINSKLDMAGVHEFMPANIRNLLLNFQSIADTNSNSILSLQQQLPFKQITDAFLGDLKLQFNDKTITFGQIALMADRILTNNDTLPNIKNNGLRPLLSLDLQQFLPNDILNVLDSLDYIDKATEIFGDGSPELDIVYELFKSNLTTHKTKKIQNIVSDPNEYKAPEITLNDPLGLGIQSRFNSEIRDDYIFQIDVTMQQINQSFVISSEDSDELKEIFIEDLDSNLDDALNGGIGLPALKESSTAISNDTHNKTVAAIILAFDTFTMTLIEELGIVSPEGNVRSIDQLLNLKRHLRSRLNLPRLGATQNEIVTVENNLKELLLNKDMSETRLLQLNKTVEQLLNEQVEVC